MHEDTHPDPRDEAGGAGLAPEPGPAAASELAAGPDPAAGAGLAPDGDLTQPLDARPATSRASHGTGLARQWASLAAALVLLVLLIIFIAENSSSVTVSFLGAHGSISLGLALLIAAVVGASVTLLAAGASILRLRWQQRRRDRRRAP